MLGANEQECDGSRLRAWGIVIVCLGAAFQLWFWLWTDWTVEDGLIVARISRNLARYGQLTFNSPGELLSSATSPLYALAGGILAIAGLPALTGLKILGAFSTLATGLVLLWLGRDVIRFRAALLAAVGYVLLPSVVAYSQCGLEVAPYAFICALCLTDSVRGKHRRALSLGALSTVVRPDGVLVLVTTAVAALSARKGWREYVRWFVAPLAVLAAYGLLHALYFGTWVPHSLTAKLGVYSVEPLRNVKLYLIRIFLARPESLPLYGLMILGMFFSLRRRPSLGILAGWYALYHLAFMLRAPLFSWYLHPPVFVLILFAGIGADAILKSAERHGGRGPVWHLTRPVPVLALVAILAIPAMVHYGRGKVRQRGYERTVREAAGRWLTSNSEQGERVFTESLGWIGYYAHNRFVDWPGLVDKEVHGIASGHSRLEGYRRVIEAKEPTWLVLRESEWTHLEVSLRHHYMLRESFPTPSTDGEGYLIARRRESPRCMERAGEPGL